MKVLMRGQPLRARATMNECWYAICNLACMSQVTALGSMGTRTH
jgi:hypothetical protein